MYKSWYPKRIKWNSGNLFSGLIFPDGAIPIVPVQAGPKSERISPNKLDATTTSNHSGLSTNLATKISIWNWSVGYAAALNKSIIIIHNEEHQHALKEVDAAAAAVASDQKQAVRILKYVLQGTLK